MNLNAVLIITISTIRMIFPGMAPTVELPGRESEPTIPVTRSVAMGLFSTRELGPDSYAWVRVPAGLGVADRVAMEMDRQRPRGESSAADQKTSGSTISQKNYWGCGDEIPQGQPALRTPDQPSGSSFQASLPRKSFSFWPGISQKPLRESATVAGLYTLETNYTGATSITLTSEQEFLPTIQMVSDPAGFDFSKPIRIAWQPVPNAVGYLVTVFGGTKDQSVHWSSSSDFDSAEGLGDRAVGEEELKSLLEKGILLPAKETRCTMPAGVLAEANGAMMTITAFGRDLIQEKNGVQTQVVVRSTVTIAMLRKKPAGG